MLLLFPTCACMHIKLCTFVLNLVSMIFLGLPSLYIYILKHLNGNVLHLVNSFFIV